MEPTPGTVADEGAVATFPVLTAEPGAVDPTGTSYLVVRCGEDVRARRVAAEWARATGDAPTQVLTLGSLTDAGEAARLADALAGCRVGVRIMVVGGRYDVLTACATARDLGALPVELTSHIVDTADLPVFCVHCRATFRAESGPGENADCPGCHRTVEVHVHFSSAHGSYLASDAAAYDLEPS